MKTINFKSAIWLATILSAAFVGVEVNAADEVYETQVVAPGISISDGRFGTAIAMAGDIAAVTTKNTPYTYVYLKRTAGTWLERARLHTGLNGFVALNVAISDPDYYGQYTIAVSGVLDYWIPSPVVVVFSGNGSNWSRTAVLGDIPGAQLPNMPIALDGERLAVAGEEFIVVYRKNNSGWVGESVVSTPARPCGGVYPCVAQRSLAMSGGRIFLGEPYANGEAIRSGIVYVYGYGYANPSQLLVSASYTTITLASWFLRGTLQAADGQANDGFGAALAVDSNTVLVGALWADGPSKDTGAMYAFSRAGDEWKSEGKLVVSDSWPGARIGSTVALAGDVAVAGSVTSTGTGSAYVFTRSSNRSGDALWTERTALVPGIQNAYDGFGYAVAIEGDSILVGAPRRYGTRFYEGAAFVFTCSNSIADCWKYQ